MDGSGPLGTLWVGLGLGAFYLALTWINVLLGNFLTPLFLIPLTWLQDAVTGRGGQPGTTTPAERAAATRTDGRGTVPPPAAR